MNKEAEPKETTEQGVDYQFNTGIIPPNQQWHQRREVPEIVPAATVTYAHVSPPPKRYYWHNYKLLANFKFPRTTINFVVVHFFHKVQKILNKRSGP